MQRKVILDELYQRGQDPKVLKDMVLQLMKTTQVSPQMNKDGIFDEYINMFKQLKLEEEKKINIKNQ